MNRKDRMRVISRTLEGNLNLDSIHETFGDLHLRSSLWPEAVEAEDTHLRLMDDLEKGMTKQQFALLTKLDNGVAHMVAVAEDSSLEVGIVLGLLVAGIEPNRAANIAAFLTAAEGASLNRPTS